MSEYVVSTVNMPSHVMEVLALWCGDEVVRCRDCYFSDEIEGGYWCDRFTCGKELVTPNGYCKWGVRRDV